MAKVRSGRLARTYGQALFLACSEDQFDVVAGELQSFCGLLAAARDVSEALTSPIVSSEKKEELTRAIAERLALSGPVTNLLRLVAERGRFGLLELITAAFNHAVREYRRVLAVEVSVARAMSEDEERSIRDQLQRAVHPSLAIDFQVDPTVVGGIVVRSGDKVFDASIRTRLRRLEAALVSPIPH